MTRYFEPFPIFSGRWLRAGALLGAACALAGCVTQQISVITLSSVVRGDVAFVKEIPDDAMHVTRNDKVYGVVPEMQLELGDTLRTGPDTNAVVTYPGGARAYLHPNTQVRIGSIIDDFGKVYVKVIKAQGQFKVKTTFVTAGSAGTEYWVDVRPRNEVKVVVVEDVVVLESTNGGWAEQRLQAGQQALFRAAAPGLLSAADPAEINREKEWVRALDRRVPVKMTVSKVALGAALVGATILLRGFDHGSDPPAKPKSD